MTRFEKYADFIHVGLHLNTAGFVWRWHINDASLLTRFCGHLIRHLLKIRACFDAQPPRHISTFYDTSTLSA